MERSHSQEYFEEDDKIDVKRNIDDIQNDMPKSIYIEYFEEDDKTDVKKVHGKGNTIKSFKCTACVQVVCTGCDNN